MGLLRTALCVSSVTGAILLARPATSGQPIEHLVSGAATANGTVLVAGTTGARYELKGGPVIDIAPGSEFSFDPSRRVPLGKPGAPDTLTRVVRLTRGTVEVTVPTVKKEPTAVMVRGLGKMSSVTRGGIATYVVDGDRSTVACRSGDTLVGLGNDWKGLKEGFARTLAPEDPTALVHPLLGAPSPRFDRGLVFVRGNESGHAEASWQPVKGAVRYDVRVSRGESKNAVLVSHESTASPSAPLRDLTAGTYAVVVSAIDKSGLLGVSSESKSLRVARLQVPEGATVTDDGTIILSKEQRVTVLGSEGLEVSYGTSTFFGSAPNTLGLSHNESVVARLRAPGSADETIIRLEPRGLRARVHFDPKAAYWPSDKVTVTVELYDTTGRTVPDGADVEPVVTVNLEPVKLDWQRSGYTLRAVVPQSPTPGPWIVRAEVADAHGEMLGRDFVEVAKPDTRSTARGIAHR